MREMLKISKNMAKVHTFFSNSILVEKLKKLPLKGNGIMIF